MRQVSIGSGARLAVGVGVICALGLANVAAAQEDDDRPRGASQVAVEEIVVRATKKSEAELAQDVPISVSAFSGEQLDALQYRDIETLSFSMPNVTLDSVGTAKGIANFSIRGLGINSSIPSIDPTVGVFVDGMYLGVNVGVVTDTFDLESVEVLRGPQGLLFGRNVTGGAVLLRSRRPGDELSATLRTRVETGIEYSIAGSIDVPLVEDMLYARISAQWRDDDGWFENNVPREEGGFTEVNFGREDQITVKPVILFTPTDEIDITFIYEHGQNDAAGPAAQNRGFFGPNAPDAELDGAFDFSIDEPGFSKIQWDHTILEANIEIGPGKLTNIFSWREVSQNSLSDIDATPESIFHAQAKTRQRQFSNELRYAVNELFDRVDLTSGLYFFTQDTRYRERRLIINGLLDTTLGGDQDHETWGLFSQADVSILENLIFTVGLRFTYEEKDVKIATFSTSSSPCGVLSPTCDFDFVDEDDWNNLTPKVGMSYFPQDDLQLYWYYTQGFRSGGYNFRNTSLDPDLGPGPFNEEEQHSVEIGMKSEFFDNRLRLNVAAFFNYIEDLQREINLPDPTAGVIQVIRNTADVRVYGGEADALFQIMDNWVATGAVGYTYSDYDEVRFDLNGDGVINGADKDLDLPRMPNWTISTGSTYDHEFGDFGLATLLANYAYRDRSFFTDNNRGTLPDGHVINASLGFSPYDIEVAGVPLDVRVTVYGRNLLNEAFRGGDSILPPDIAGAVPLGGTFSPLKEGRSIGGEIQVSF